MFDAQLFSERLRERERCTGCAHELKLSLSNELVAAFWVADGGAERWAALRDAKVVLYDTKHGTNKYRCKLGCWTSVDENGDTRIIAFSLVDEGESKESFTWAFQQFAKHLSPPSVIFTDGDVGMAGAIETVFSKAGTVHLLCVYHIYTNVYKHMHGLIRDKKEWRTFVSKFWSIAKKTDIRSVDDFHRDWVALTNLATGSRGGSDDERRKALKWLANLGTRASKWAARWTWQKLTLGIHSTQRAEALHSAFSHIIRNSDNLATLFDKLERFEDNQAIVKQMKNERVALVHVSARAAASARALHPQHSRAPRASRMSHPPFPSLPSPPNPSPFHPYTQGLPMNSDVGLVKNLPAKIPPPHALMRVRKQASLSLNYCVTQADVGGAGGSAQGLSTSTKWRVQVIGAVELTRGEDEEEAAQDALLNGIDVRVVPPYVLHSDLGQLTDDISHEVTISSCTCQLPSCSGLPCRHQLAVYQMLLSAGTEDVGSLTAFVTTQVAPIWLANSHTDAKVIFYATRNSAACNGS